MCSIRFELRNLEDLSHAQSECADQDDATEHKQDADALLARTDQVLTGEMPLRPKRSHLVYDPEIDEGHNEDLWLDVVKRTATWPAIAAAAIACDARTTLEMYARQPWLGLIMAAAILWARGLTCHLLPLVTGYRASRYRLQGRQGGAEKVEAFARLVREAVTQGERDLQRLVLARETMMRQARGCCSGSRLRATHVCPRLARHLGAQRIDGSPGNEFAIGERRVLLKGCRRSQLISTTENGLR